MPTPEYKYFTLICDSAKGKFPSAFMSSSAMFRCPITEKWTVVRAAAFRAVKEFGFRKIDVYETQHIEEGNFSAGKKWTQFDYQDGRFIMTNPGQLPKPVKPTSSAEVERFIKQRQAENIDWIKGCYKRAGYGDITDEQAIELLKKTKKI